MYKRKRYVTCGSLIYLNILNFKIGIHKRLSFCLSLYIVFENNVTVFSNTGRLFDVLSTHYYYP